MFLARMFFVLAMTVMLACGAAAAESPYKGKTIKIFSLYPPGGDYDTHARLLARHIGKHIPDKPKVLVINMPGASGLIGANYAYNVLRPDGFSVVQLSWDVISAQMENLPGVAYDVGEFIWMEVGDNPPAPMHVWALAPKTPTDKVAILRKAFEATLKDPAFLADVKRNGLKSAKEQWMAPFRGFRY